MKSQIENAWWHWMGRGRRRARGKLRSQIDNAGEERKSLIEDAGEKVMERGRSRG